MAEANHSVHQAQVRAMAAAVMVLARQRAIKEAKREFQARGLRPHHMPHREMMSEPGSQCRRRMRDNNSPRVMVGSASAMARRRREGFACEFKTAPVVFVG
jgi:hypothetical protein